MNNTKITILDLKIVEVDTITFSDKRVHLKVVRNDGQICDRLLTTAEARALGERLITLAARASL